MSLTIDKERPIHFPADQNKFKFDGEVAEIFPDMAVRSIPNFEEAHAAHARMIAPWIIDGVRILDIGASRGAFIRHVSKTYPDLWMRGKISYDAIDNSPEMCAYLRRDYPNVFVRQEDIALDRFASSPTGLYDIVCVNYVLQFLDPSNQMAVMLDIFRQVRVGGVLIFGHKSAHSGVSGNAAHEEYIRFRMNHGYSREEIEAKTKALKGAMFPMNHATLMQTLRSHFRETTETFRFMMFSTLMAVK